MKKNSILWAVLPMMAATLMTTSCSNEDSAVETPAQQNGAKTIPYTVTVNDGATTRATVDSDNKTLKFAAGDKLYISGTNISGVLDIQTGTGTASATFSGGLTYTGSGTPADNLELSATLVGSSNVGVQITDGKVTGMTYPTTAFCTSVNDAVQKYSNLTGTSTYAAKSFSLTQQTAFLNFEITSSGSTGNYTAPAKFINNGSDFATANVTTVNDGGSIKAKFVLPVASGTALSNATVKFAGKQITGSINDATLTAKVYNVTKTVDMSEVTLADAFTDDAVVSVTVNTYNSYSNSATGTYSAGTYTSVTGSEGTSGVSMTKDGSNLVVTMTRYNTYTVTFNTTNNTYMENATSASSVWRMKDLKSITINGVDITSTLTAVPSETITLTGGSDTDENTYSGTHFQVTGYGDDTKVTVNKWNNMVISAKTGKTIVDVVFSYKVDMNLNALTFSSGTFNGSNMVENVNATSLTVGSTSSAGTQFNGVTIYYSE